MGGAKTRTEAMNMAHFVLLVGIGQFVGSLFRRREAASCRMVAFCFGGVHIIGFWFFWRRRQSKLARLVLTF